MKTVAPDARFWQQLFHRDAAQSVQGQGRREGFNFHAGTKPSSKPSTSHGSSAMPMQSLPQVESRPIWTRLWKAERDARTDGFLWSVDAHMVSQIVSHTVIADPNPASGLGNRGGITPAASGHREEEEG